MAAGGNGGRWPAASSLTRQASSAPAASPMAAAVPAPCARAAARPLAPDARKRGNQRENVPRRAFAMESREAQTSQTRGRLGQIPPPLFWPSLGFKLVNCKGEGQ